MITVVSLHWKRTDNTQMILGFLKNQRLVSEVIVWNNNPEVNLECGDGIRVINSSDDFGLNTRFSAALLAANDCILTVDDDILPHGETVESLFNCWQEEPHVAHTLHGRTPTHENTYAIDVDGQSGKYVEAEISLTRCTMYHKQHAAKYFEVEPQIRDRDHETPNNGEDIILSYVARSVSGKLNRVYNFPRSELNAPHSIHGRAGHREYRTHLMRRCQSFFGFDR